MVLRQPPSPHLTCIVAGGVSSGIVYLQGKHIDTSDQVLTLGTVKFAVGTNIHENIYLRDTKMFKLM